MIENKFNYIFITILGGLVGFFSTYLLCPITIEKLSRLGGIQ